MNVMDRIKEIERRIQTMNRLLLNARRTYTLGLHHAQHEPPAGEDQIAHASQHLAAGSDVIKLDDLAAPDDTTDLDALITRHGLCPKLPNDVLKYLDGLGAWSVPAGGGGGSDPWSTKKLSSDFSTTSGTPVDVTGLNFTPAANKIYAIEGTLLLRTSNASYGVRIGSVQPSGLEDGVIAYGVATAAGSTSLFNVGAIASEWVHLLTALADAVNSWPAWLKAVLVVGATPAGDFQIRVRSETNGIEVFVKKGSYLRYREI